MEEQKRVSDFLDDHGLRTTPTYRVLDLASETGELAKDVNESSSYGGKPDEGTVSLGEVGDTLFCVLALADEAGIDAGEALTNTLAKYEERMTDREAPGSGSHDD